MGLRQLRKQEERSPMTKSYNISKKLIWEAYQCVKANGGTAGIDCESIEEFERCLSDNLYKLWNRMCSGSYFPPPVKGVPIPKKIRRGAHTRNTDGCRQDSTGSS